MYSSETASTNSQSWTDKVVGGCTALWNLNGSSTVASRTKSLADVGCRLWKFGLDCPSSRTRVNSLAYCVSTSRDALNFSWCSSSSSCRTENGKHKNIWGCETAFPADTNRVGRCLDRVETIKKHIQQNITMRDAPVTWSAFIASLATQHRGSWGRWWDRADRYCIEGVSAQWTVIQEIWGEMDCTSRTRFVFGWIEFLRGPDYAPLEAAF